MARLRFIYIGFFFTGMLVGCSTPSPIAELSLNAAAGPYLQQYSSNSETSLLGTGFLVELRQGGKRLDREAEVSVTGPEGWNDSQPVTFAYPTGSYWITAQEMSALPVVGEYRITVQSGDDQVSTVAVVRSLEPLELPQVETVKLNEKVAVSWSEVEDAVGYYVKLLDTGNATQLGMTGYTTSTEAIFPLNDASDAVAVVYSTNFDTVAEAFAFPEQLRMSERVFEISSEEGR